MAKTIDAYLNAINYLRYDDLLKMPMPLLNALMEVKIESANSDSGSDVKQLGPLLNAFLGRR